MKLQYLGDSRDSFKWHYHDSLANGMNARYLDIIPMLLPNDESGQGDTHANEYPATPEIQKFCEHLRENPFLHSIEKLPEFVGSNYRVRIHKPYEKYTFRNSRKYFDDIDGGNLTFIDPCTGFKPKHGKDEHISFADLSYLIDVLPKCAIISVYQHKQRRTFQDTYSDIRRYMKAHHRHTKLTAIHNSHVMMVQITICTDRLESVRGINKAYASENDNINIFI